MADIEKANYSVCRKDESRGRTLTVWTEVGYQSVLQLEMVHLTMVEMSKLNTKGYLSAYVLANKEK